MWHMYMNSDGLIEFAFVNRNSIYVAGTRQGYATKTVAWKSMRSIMFATGTGCSSFKVQDDTKNIPIVYIVGRATRFRADEKPHRKYIPKVTGR